MRKDCLYVILGAVMMGSLPVFVRNIEMSAISITFFRLFLGFVFLSLFMLLLGEKPEIKDWKIVFAIAAVNTATIVCYIASIQTTKVAAAALMLYMAPIYVIPLSHLIGEKVNWKSYLALPLGLLGLWLIVSPRELSGDIFGILSGIFYAIYFILMKRARMKMDSLHITFAYLAVSSAILLILLIPFSPSIRLRCSIFWLLGLGIIPTAAAFTVFNHGIKGCGASRSSLSALVEPVSAGIFGFVFFGETLSLQQAAGAMLILSAVGLSIF